MGLKTSGDALTADGVMGIIGIDKAQVIRRDGHAQGLEGLFNALFLLSGQAHVFLELIKSLDAVFHLPFPIVPLFVGDIGKQLFSS